MKPNDYYVAEYERRIAEGMDRASAWDEVDDMMLADKRAERATRRQETQELRERVAQLEVQLALLERVR